MAAAGLVAAAFMKAKPVKWDVKVWVCLDAVTGYICSFKIYTGKDPSKPVHPKGLAHEVVTSPVGKYLHKGYIYCVHRQFLHKP